jgi:hypothetical protein
MKQARNKLDFSSPKEKEKREIEEIRNLSYPERLERLFAILESSRIFKTCKIKGKS